MKDTFRSEGGPRRFPLAMFALLALSFFFVFFPRPADSRDIELRRPDTGAASARPGSHPEDAAAAPHRDAERSSAANARGLSPSGAGDLPRLREFPHLLRVDLPNPYGAPDSVDPSTLRRRGTRGNAHFDPGSGLPPTTLSHSAFERARRIVGGTTTDLEAELRKEPDPLDLSRVQRVCVLRVDFLNDTPAERTTGDGRFDLRESTEIEGEIPLDPPPHDKSYFDKHMEALDRYYRAQSNGKIQLEWDIWPAAEDSAFHLEDTFKYGPWIFSNSNPDVLQHAIDLVGDGLRAADSSDEPIDFSSYDQFILFHAGADFQGDVNRDTPWDIPSFNLFVVDPFVVQEDVCIDLVMVVPETVTQDQFQGALNGVVAHEFGHQFGFFDLYDVSNGLTVVGAYSLMDSGDNQFALIEDPTDPTRNLAVRGTLPASLDPFHKVLWFGNVPGAVDFIDASSSADGGSKLETTLDAVQLSNDIVYTPLNLSEYYLMENRHLDLNGDSTVIIRQDPETGVILGPEPDSSAVGDTLGYYEYDWLIPGEGVLVWHVDNLAINAGLQSAGGGINVFFNRPGVAVVEADGIRDIGTSSSEFLGGPYDPFFVGGYSRLGANTDPPSETNDGTPTGVEMSVLDSVGLAMRIEVELGQNAPNWPLVVGAEPGAEQTVVLDLDGDGLASIVMPAVLPSGEPALVQLSERGARDPILLFSPLAAAPTLGLAATERFDGLRDAEDRPAPLLAGVVDGHLQVWDGRGVRVLSWPIASSDIAITTTPVLLGASILVGADDGVIYKLDLDGTVGGPTSFGVTPYPQADLPIGALGAGRPGDSASLPTQVFWSTSEGRSGVLTLDRDGQETSRWASSVVRSPGSEPLPPLAVPIAGSGTRYLFGWQDGTFEWRDATGALLPGWPVQVANEVHGQPIVADPDGDGELETICLDARGALHAFAWNGVEDRGYPRSIWTEDESGSSTQTLPPLAWNVDEDDDPELVVHRADGFLVATDGDGTRVEGWPLAIGAPAVNGPFLLPDDGGSRSSLVLHNLSNACGTLPCGEVSVLELDIDDVEGIGSFPVPGLGYTRNRVYPEAWVPVSKDIDGDLIAESVALYPNPLRGEELTVSFQLGRPATIDLDAFDLSGAKVASKRIDGAAGAQGNHIAWNLASLAPGLYHVRFRASGDGFAREQFEKVAIVR